MKLTKLKVLFEHDYFQDGNVCPMESVIEIEENPSVKNWVADGWLGTPDSPDDPVTYSPPNQKRETKGKEKTKEPETGKTKDDSPIDKITEAIKGLDKSDFLKSGLPKVPALTKAVGFEVTAAQRDQAWELSQSK